jgi:putative Mg2+ transporter-C (MgtC) family protein
MNISFDIEIGVQLLISFGIGTAIGLEREYRSKAAGLRTMIMICLGSTIFTELSILLGNSTTDRIASNIVTGVGFLGAGVIFKDGLNVSGLTTATTIWICAALGMAVGAGEYFVAIVSTGVVVIVLGVFPKAQDYIERIHQVRIYRICFDIHDDLLPSLETWLEKEKIRGRMKKTSREGDRITATYELRGSEKGLNSFSQHLRHEKRVTSFEF